MTTQIKDANMITAKEAHANTVESMNKDSDEACNKILQDIERAIGVQIENQFFSLDFYLPNNTIAPVVKQKLESLGYDVKGERIEKAQVKLQIAWKNE